MWPKVFERFRRVFLAARLLHVRGKLQRQGRVIHVIADALLDLSGDLNLLLSDKGEAISTLAHADEVKRGPHETTLTIKSRDFH